MTRARTWISAGTLVTLVTACATASPVVRTRPLDRSLYVGSMGQTTRFERTGPRAAPDQGLKHPNASAISFVVATVLGSVAAAGALAFGIAGTVTDRKLQDGYDNGLTLDEQNRLRDRGELFNDLTIGLGVTGLVSLTAAAIIYGVDYTRCGHLARKRRKCEDVHAGARPLGEDPDARASEAPLPEDELPEPAPPPTQPLPEDAPGASEPGASEPGATAARPTLEWLRTGDPLPPPPSVGAGFFL